MFSWLGTLWIPFVREGAFKLSETLTSQLREGREKTAPAQLAAYGISIFWVPPPYPFLGKSGASQCNGGLMPA